MPPHPCRRVAADLKGKDNMKMWITDRLRERSTWVGLAGLVSALGIGIEPAQMDAIAAAGAAVAGLLAVFWPDKR